VAETSLPLVTVLGAASFAVVALAWTDASIAPLLVDLDTVRVAVLAIAIASILLASLAAWIQDDIEHVVGYSIVGDAGVVMLAIAALDPDAWAPARTWILALVAARCAFAGWAAAARLLHATGRVADLRGWAITSPILAVGFAAVVLASIGLPGLAAFEARTDLVEFALGSGPLAMIVFLGTLAPLIYYGRLAVIGVSRPEAGREPLAGWRPIVGRLDLNDVRGWLSRTWAANRSVVASGTSVLMGLIAVAVMAGAFGVPDAAAALPPTLEQAVESFAPEEAPPVEEPLPSEVVPSSEETTPSGATPSGATPSELEPSFSVPAPS
jgi:formate hydrogenlyase subunit 3/multisubunit Na+/H+ antiporter MnhD subunit